MTHSAEITSSLQINYERYLDQILGGWIGKSMGGAIGARFEGNKGWIDIPAEEMYPVVTPPNDDLDLQVLWLKVLEEKGAALTADDLAEAWLEGCWYPFNEYGIFRRNYRLGIRPPMSGRFGNQFWDTGMGCPIRAEIWGYAFPGAPDLAARYATLDGCLDHTEQSIGAERMFAAMSSLAFFVPDVRRLTSLCLHYLPVGTPVERLTREAFRCHEEGVPLRDARDRLMALAGNPEACDAQTNVPFTFLALLYGGNDLQETLQAALRCGYDTDCTLATAGALLGQILGASRIAGPLRERVGDELVMGIQYRRPEMTLSALARDTARMGVLLQGESGVKIVDSPDLAPFPVTARSPAFRFTVDYQGLPAAAPGDVLSVKLCIEGAIPTGVLRIEAPEGWTVAPASVRVHRLHREITLTLIAPAEPETWPQRHLFTAVLNDVRHDFGVAGAGLWKFLGLYYDALPDPNDPVQVARAFNHHYVSLQRDYLTEPAVDVAGKYQDWSRKLGRPAVIRSYEHEIDLGQLVQLTGPYCAYVAREVIAPDDREVYAMIGNNDAFRLYVNGELAAEVEETIWWTPFNNFPRIRLRQGKNLLVLKLLKRGDALRFTFGLRETATPHGYGGGANWQDWCIDLADGVPAL
jgi:ADP-ribosylglycohydrolase